MSTAETLETAGPEPRGEMGEFRRDDELTQNHVAITLLLVSDELFGINRDADLSQQDIERFVGGVEEIFMDVSEVDMPFDGGQAVSLLQSRVNTRPAPTQINDPDRQPDSSVYFFRSRLQRASHAAVKLLSYTEDQGGLVARHQIEDVVLRLYDTATDYIDPGYDTNVNEIIAHLQEEFFYKQLRHHDEKKSAPAAGEATRSSSIGVGSTAVSGFFARRYAPVPC